jgi:integrase/recombinase XerD
MTQEEILEKLVKDIQLRGLSIHTEHGYSAKAKQFMRHYGKPAIELGEQEIREYLHYLANGKKLTPGSVNNVNSCLRFLFEVTLEQNLNYKRIPRLKDRILLPNVMTAEEIKRFFDAIDNLKHKAIFMTIYGSGLRLGEIRRLKISDVDSKYMRLFISQGKGKKDRYAVLSQTSLDAMREYWKKYRPRHPDGYLFLNREGTACMTDRAIQDAFMKYKEKAGIAHRATVHTLRHSYATHLLEAGTNIFFIRQLLGHSTLSTTTRYLHVAQTDVLKTPSPLDTMSAAPLKKKRGRPRMQVTANA